MIIAGSKIYETCGKCGQLVCVNKWLFGSLHICDPSEAVPCSPSRYPNHPVRYTSAATTHLHEAGWITKGDVMYPPGWPLPKDPPEPFGDGEGI